MIVTWGWDDCSGGFVEKHHHWLCSQTASCDVLLQSEEVATLKVGDRNNHNNFQSNECSRITFHLFLKLSIFYPHA